MGAPERHPTSAGVDDAVGLGAEGVRLDREAPVERTWLDEGSWFDVTPSFVRGADTLYELLVESVPFTQREVYRYDHWKPEPRLGWWFTPGTAPHSVLVDAHRTLQHRYGVRFDGAALALYRDGRDSIAPHRDRDLRWLDDTVIALLVLGERRPFVVQPLDAHDGGGLELRPGHGDLLVMGGATQARWRHGVPKVDATIGGRISVQWRWTSRRGRMERGGSYSKPRHYGR
ncbi:MAG: alpha-ketoglutarate-dependent dioxygenase AlkB [Acidimicrobiales bacterium]|nr:alpha-ketoglutarate-dependent dioxygenase AlkB [Acidimicrobiales bacterium]